MFQILMTDTGQAAFTAAQLDDDIDLELSEVGFTDQAFVPDAAMVALPGELKRVDTLSGEQVDEDTIHLTIQDTSADAYAVRGFGLYLADGTLFGVYGQAGLIVEKSDVSSIYIALDINFLPDVAAEIVFGNATFTNPPATETVKGVAEIATQAETDTGTDDTRIVSPKKLAGRLTSILASIAAIVAELATLPTTYALRSRTISAAGLATGGGDLTANRTITVTKASSAEVQAGTEDAKAITPAGLWSSLRSIAANGYLRIPGSPLIIQWGTFLASAGTTTVVTFPIAFPNACFVVQASSQNGTSSTNNGPIARVAPSATQFTVYSSYSLDGSMFIAIGW